MHRVGFINAGMWIIRMKRFLILIAVLALTTILGCGKNADLAKDADLAKNADLEESADQATTNLADDLGIEVVKDEIPNTVEDEDTTVEPASFKFVDVFGEEYEATILPDFPKTEFINEKYYFENGRTYYEDENYLSRQGIDVSGYQGKIDWGKVKVSGIEFVIIRIGFRGYGQSGTLNLDKRFLENIKGAQAAGLDTGVYIFSQAINEAEAVEEAEFVLSNLDGYELQMPIVYDPESILDDVARTDNVTAEQFTKNSIAFCNRIKEAGFEPMIYSNMLWEAFNLNIEELRDYPFWYADYETLPQTPYAYTMWQYSSEGVVDGVSGAVDLDIQFIKK